MKRSVNSMLKIPLLAGLCAIAADARADIYCSGSLPCETVSNSGTGIGISAGGGTGEPAVYGTSNYAGLWGNNTTGMGVGVKGSSSNNIGVDGDGPVIGVRGSSSGGDGVFGTSSAASGKGVHGDVAGPSAYGVYGLSTNYVGVYGVTGSSGLYGILGYAPNGIAIRGTGYTRGVHGEASATGGIGVSGSSLGAGKGIYGSVTPAGPGYSVYGENNSTALGAWAGYFYGKLNVTGKAVCPSCTNGLWFNSESDARLKKDVQSITDGLDNVMKLRPVTFRWKDPATHGGEAGIQRGFIAQEVEKVMPEWVGVNENGNKTVNYNGLTPLLVDGVHTLKAENDSLRDRVKALENRQPFATAGLNGNGVLGLGLIVLGGAIVASRRRTAPQNA
jgi:hypothetical protein